MFEHSSLQEAYTGSLIAGKGKFLNNIRTIMERTKLKQEDWARVRFGAGTPWRRCWCVITPPDEKEYQKLQKTLKKRTAYDRSTPILKGDLKFYENKKITKKTKPIATITDLYSAYAIYPQSKPLIDQSTLVKLEGQITVHSSPETTTEGFIFAMPEAHPAVSGFEMLLRFLFPVWDAFALYGRPTRLIADVLDPRGLMFALPKDRRYGYLDILDVASLVHTEGSQNWTERRWRKEMKDLTSKRMTAPQFADGGASLGRRRNTTSRTSLPSGRSASLKFDESASVRSTPGTRQGSPDPPSERLDGGTESPRRVDSAPPGAMAATRHQRSASDANGYKNTSRLAHETNANDEYDLAPPPPTHRLAMNGEGGSYDGSDRATPELEAPRPGLIPEVQAMAARTPPPAPVAAPPAFQHGPTQKPPVRPYQAPDLRRANSAIDAATLSQLADASNVPLSATVAAAGTSVAWGQNEDATRSDEMQSVGHGRPWMDGGQGGLYPWDARSRSAEDLPYRQVPPINNPRSRQPNARLPTIPASPFIEQSEPSPRPSYFEPAAPPVPEHGEPPASSFPQLLPPLAAASAETSTSNYDQQMNSGFHQMSLSPPPQGVQRKPLPTGPTPPPEDGRAFSLSSDAGSLRDHLVDVDALDALVPQSPPRQQPLQRVITRESTTQDNESEPDYASTKSSDTKESAERPRFGVLRTVGTPEPTLQPTVVVGDAHYGSSTEPQINPSTDIPEVDFGATYALTPGIRPDTSGTLTPSDMGKDGQRVRYTDGSSPGHEERRTLSPAGSTRHSPAGSRSNTPGPSPGGSVGRASPASVLDPRRTHSRTSSNEHILADQRTPGRNSPLGVPWQPGSTIGTGASGRPGLSPEDWVQQRARVASQPHVPSSRLASAPIPLYAHGRSASSGDVPPLGRNPSGDYSQTQQQTNSRSPSGATTPNRPSSRAASYMLNGGRASPVADVTQHLSAHERMHVSRMTGAPLVHLTNNPRTTHQRQPSYGLIGAIEAREKEKAAIKKGGNTVAVQMAIDAHHRHQSADQQRRERARAEREQAQALAAAQQAFAFQQQQQLAAQGQFMQQQQQQQQQGYMGAQPQGYGVPPQFYAQQQQQQQQAYGPLSPGFIPGQQPYLPQQQMAMPIQMPRQQDRPLTREEADELQERARALNQARGLPHTGGPAPKRFF